MSIPICVKIVFQAIKYKVDNIMLNSYADYLFTKRHKYVGAYTIANLNRFCFTHCELQMIVESS